jgi:hypothetical protein
MRSVRVRGPVVILAALAFASAATMRAADAWSALGGGVGAAKATSVVAAPAPTATLSAGTIAVRWSPVAIAETYRVQRFDPSGSPGVPVGACASPTGGTSCVESPAPPGTWTYAVRAARAGWNAPQGPTGAPVVVVVEDVTPPTVASAAVGLAEGASSGWIRSSGSYRVFASATDAGASGLASVRADVSAITGVPSVVALASGGPWWVGGESFGWRSPPFTAAANLTEGTERTFTVTATDGAGNVGSRGGKTTVDGTGPSTLDVQTTPGTTAGKAEAGDRVIFTFSEAVDPASLLAGWTAQANATVTVRITDGGSGNDVLTVWDATNTVQVGLGSVNLDRTDYVTSTVLFGSTGAPSSMALSGATVTVTLGAPNLATRISSGTGAGSMLWTPSVAVTDRAGNPCTAATRTESGARDREF